MCELARLAICVGRCNGDATDVSKKISFGASVCITSVTLATHDDRPKLTPQTVTKLSQVVVLPADRTQMSYNGFSPDLMTAYCAHTQDAHDRQGGI